MGWPLVHAFFGGEQRRTLVTLPGGDGMPSLDLLERAAQSLGMTTCRAHSTLEVVLPGAITVGVSEVNDRLASSVRLGWVRLVAAALVGGSTAIAFLLYPTNRFTEMLVFLTLLGLVQEMLRSARAERLQERLFDRAYDLQKSGTEKTQG
jgi:hypothetical protein